MLRGTGRMTILMASDAYIAASAGACSLLSVASTAVSVIKRNQDYKGRTKDANYWWQSAYEVGSVFLPGLRAAPKAVHAMNGIRARIRKYVPAKPPNRSAHAASSRHFTTWTRGYVRAINGNKVVSAVRVSGVGFSAGRLSVQ